MSYKSKITEVVRRGFVCSNGQFDRETARQIASVSRDAFVLGHMTLDEITQTIREAKGDDVVIPPHFANVYKRNSDFYFYGNFSEDLIKTLLGMGCNVHISPRTR